MKNIKSAICGLALLVSLSIFLTIGCTKDPINNIPNVPGVTGSGGLPAIDTILLKAMKTQNCDTFNFVVKNLQIFNAPTPIGTVALAPAATSTDHGWRCTSQDFKASEGFSEMNVMGQVPFFTTGLYDGASISTGGNKELIGDRLPWKISTDLNTTGVPTEIVEHPDQLSSYREALQRLLDRADFTAPPPANISFEIDSVYSKEQAEMLTGANFGGWGAKVSGNYNFGNQSIKSRLLVRFVQRYFTVDMDTPDSPCALFDTLPDLSGFGTSPMYVSSVTYGRVAYMMIESSSSMDSTAWAVKASYDGFGYDGGLHVNSKAINIMNSANIRGFILGGSGSDAVGGINGFEGLKKYILDGGNPSATSPGAPIGYRFKNLVDNSDVKIVLASEYTVRSCDNVGEVVDAPGLASEIFKPGVQWNGTTPDGIGHDGNEFNGNGPDISGTFQLERRNGNKEVFLVVNVTWVETAENRSMAVAHLEQPVYTAPPGKVLGAFPELDKVTFFYSDKKTDHVEVAGVDFDLQGGSFIGNLRVVGDSDGEDMDGDPDHDCGVRFFLKPFKVSLKDL